MTMEIQTVTTPEEIAAVAALAHEIWNEHFPPIIGQAQVDYMLDKFQSAPAITRQIAEGYEYYLVNLEGHPAGYLALVPSVEEGAVQLSKLYLKSEHRGSGLGKAMVDFAERRCVELGVPTLWLTVNQHNAGPIAFYERRGFRRDGELVLDIGGGFVMQDYKMVKSVSGEG
ncbi:MAG: GNAT family N-acetyltransferase [Candidatus Hydrogenedentota bacterium]